MKPSSSTTSLTDLASGSDRSLKRQQRRSASSADAKSHSLYGLKKLLHSPTQIWRSRISWRITLAAFLTIAVVQIGIMIFTVQQYEAERLSNLKEIGRSAIAPLTGNSNYSDFVSPFDAEAVKKLLSTTIISGMSVYSGHLDLIQSYGEPVSLYLRDADNLGRTHRSMDGSSYEVIYRSNDLGIPYIVVGRLDSSNVNAEVHQYQRDTILIMLLMSAFVTSVLMVTLGKWLLEPILFMRKNLIAASHNPENPQLQPSPYDESDEIGGAISIAERLIYQNADNLKRVKAAAEDKIHKLAYYDTLTKLPNRTLFLQKLSERMQIRNADDVPEKFAVVAVDLDHFKDINDSMGHNVGDAILRSVGRRLKAALPENALISRAGEDEFALTVDLGEEFKSGREVADKVIEIIRDKPFGVFNEEFQVRASIGVSVFPQDAMDADLILKNADIALNRAKEDGRNSVREYSEDFDRAVQQRFQMLRDLRDALEHDQLQLHYQPQFDLRTGELIGAEALLRWWKPDNSKEGGRYVSPVEFIPIAEQSGLILPMGEWVLYTACKTAQRWSNEFGYNGRIAVNVSPVQFTRSNIVTVVNRVLQETGVDPKRLELEVTESVFMEDVDKTIKILQELHVLGVELAIDDFGTGYSSLSYLRQFPIDRLKIDRSFISNALNNADDASIAKTIIALGHSLNLKVIAEGVETIEHEQFLLSENCDEVQGFRYSKPLSAEDIEKFIISYNGDLSSFSE